MKKLITKLALIAAGFLSAMPGYAFAQCDGCVTNAVNVANVAIVAAMQNMQSAVVDALKGGSHSMTQAQTKAAQSIADATQHAITQSKVDDTAARYQHPDECAAIGAAQSIGAATHNPGGGALGGGRNSIGMGGGAGASKDMQNAINSANRAQPPKAPEIQAAIAAKGACSTYADGLRGVDCQDAGLGGGSMSSGLPDADIRAETLIDGPQKSAGRIVRRLTVRAGSPEATAIDAYMRNLNTPIELRQLSKSELQSQAGRQYMSFRDTYDARMSLAEKPVRAMNARRLADINNNAQINVLLQSPAVGPFLAQYLKENAPNWRSEGVSADELINIEVMRRHMNEGWQVAVAAMSPEAAAKELLINSAFQNYLMWRMIQSTELASIVQGQAVSTGVRAEMTPQLNALHGAATSR